jgi:hypothetical protein
VKTTITDVAGAQVGSNELKPYHGYQKKWARIHNAEKETVFVEVILLGESLPA